MQGGDDEERRIRRLKLQRKDLYCSIRHYRVILRDPKLIVEWMKLTQSRDITQAMESLRYRIDLIKTAVKALTSQIRELESEHKPV